jgi:hypothetical protein
MLARLPLLLYLQWLIPLREIHFGITLARPFDGETKDQFS